VQLSITGKGGIVRKVLLSEPVSRSLLSLRGDAGINNDPLSVMQEGTRTTLAKEVFDTKGAARSRNAVAEH
jgi:hypothetical protein